MSDQKSSSGRFPRRTPGPWPGREAGAARRRKRLDSGHENEETMDAVGRTAIRQTNSAKSTTLPSKAPNAGNADFVALKALRRLRWLATCIFT
jgi:hypothetical protein